MFRRSRLKIILLVMGSVLLLFMSLIGVIYASSYAEINEQNKEMLQSYVDSYSLSDKNKKMQQSPEKKHTNDTPRNKDEQPPHNKDGEPPPRQELYKHVDFYSVAYDKDGTVLKIDNSQSNVIDEEAILEIAETIRTSGLEYGRSDSYIYSSEAEDGGEVDNPQNIWPVYFGQELRNNIIPTVESTYSTYARKDVSESNLVATRDHRAFAGLSRGSMTVARSGLTDNADIFAYFGNYSGIWQEFDTFKTALTQDYKDYPIKFWYNGNGKMDFAKPNHDEFMDKVKAEMPDTFTDGENFAYVVLKDGAHIYKSWLVDLYNSLLVFYK